MGLMFLLPNYESLKPQLFRQRNQMKFIKKKDFEMLWETIVGMVKNKEVKEEILQCWLEDEKDHPKVA